MRIIFEFVLMLLTEKNYQNWSMLLHGSVQFMLAEATACQSWRVFF